LTKTTCEVVSFPKDENGNAAGVNCSDPNDYSALVQVRMAAFDQTVKINTNDTVVVYGMGQGAAQGKNTFGADVTEAEVLELYLKDLTTGYIE
jgi:S-methylmethionine-dependent homocysteine/selenocysteine methylase